MPNSVEIASQLKNELEKNSSVTALVLVGSQARETVYKADQYSDLEAFVIVRDKELEKFEQELPTLVNKFGKVLFSFKHQIGFVAVYDDLFRIELPVVKQSEMNFVFSRPKAQEVKILIDKTGGKLIEVLRKRPDTIDFEQLFRDKVINFWYWQIIGIQYFKKGELYNTRAILNIHASTLIKLFELLNDSSILLLETNKRIELFLTQDQLDLLKKVTVNYNAQKIAKALRGVMNIFSDISKAIKDKYGYQYDESIEAQIKPKLLKFL